MYIGTLPPVSNKAGWSFVREVVDDDTDEPIDLSDATIVFEVRNACGTIKLSATTSNAAITILDTGVFQAAFTADQMKTLCAETYDVGCTVQNGTAEPQQFIIGKLPVLDGIVSQ